MAEYQACLRIGLSGGHLYNVVAAGLGKHASTMSARVNLYDRVGFESLRKELRLDPNVLRRFRNDLLKHFVSDEDALSRFSAADRVAVHSLELYHRSDSAVDGASKLLLKTSAGMLIEAVKEPEAKDLPK